jgi:Uma2 family endonuclease
MLPRAATDWTVTMVQAIPEDGNRYELIGGELLVNGSAATRHQAAFLKLILHLDSYTRANRLGIAVLLLTDWRPYERSNVRPDAVISRLSKGEEPFEWSEVDPLLAVDVLDPRYGRSDASVYGRYAQRDTVPEYWVLDVDGPAIWRTRAGEKRWPEEINERLEWQPVQGVAPLVIELAEFFEQI